MGQKSIWTGFLFFYVLKKFLFCTKQKATDAKQNAQLSPPELENVAEAPPGSQAKT